MDQPSTLVVYRNRLTPLVTLSSSGTVAKFPVEYTVADQRGRSCRLSGVSAKWFKGHWTTTSYDFDAACVIDSNLTADGTLELRGSTDDFVTSDVQILPPRRITQSYPSIFRLDATNQYPYVKAIYDDPANPAGYLRPGKLYLGRAIVPEEMYAWGWSPGYVDHTTVIESLNRVAHKNVKPLQAAPKLQYVQVPTADRDLVEALWREVLTRWPFLIALDTVLRPELTMYVRFSSLPDPANVHFDGWTYAFPIVEEL